MSAPQPDQIAALVDALREDLPDARERERMRARLIAAGVALSGGVAASGAASVAAAATTTASAGAATSGAQLGLLPKLATLTFAQKVGVAVVLVSAGAALPAAPKLIDVVERASARASSVDARPARPAHAARVRVTKPVEAQDSAKHALPFTQSPTAAREPQVGSEAAGAVAAKEATPVALVAAVSGREAKRSAASSRTAMQVAMETGTLATEHAKDVSGTSPRVPVHGDVADDTSPARAQRSDLAASASPAAAAGNEPAPEVALGLAAPTPAAVSTQIPEAPPDTAKSATAAANASVKDVAAATPATAPLAGSLAARLSPAAAARAAGTLRNETELLEHALAAIAADDRTSARAWLDLHAQRFPHGLLERERQRAFLHLARMRAGAPPNPTTGASTP